MKETFLIDVSYSQLAVFSPDLQDPFNAWTQEEVDAGYSWRAESVSFGIDRDGHHLVTVTIDSCFPELQSSATRTIEVLFDSSKSGEVEIASIADSKLLPLKPGRYKLRFEFLSSSPNSNIYLSFVPLLAAVE
jgi:competence protein J (ComJ)